MSPIAPGGYFFRTPAQWAACVIARAEPGGDTLRPLAPLAPAPEPAYPGAAYVPAVTAGGELLWRDAAGELQRALPGAELLEAFVPPQGLARATRVVATAGTYWAVARGGSRVEAFDERTLSRRFVVELPGDRVVDMAPHGRGIAVLVERGNCPEVVVIGCDGHVERRVVLAGLRRAIALATLARPAAFVVLAADARRLLAYGNEGGAPRWRLTLSALAPCFRADALGSDGRARVLVAGRDELPGDEGPAHLVVLDGDGVRVADVALAEPANGVAFVRDAAVVTGARGLYLLRRAAAVPDSMAEASLALVTPVLEAPDVADGRRWLRVEADGELPPGTTLEIAWAGTDDPEVAEEARKTLSQSALPAAQRIAALRGLGTWHAPLTVRGGVAGGTVLSAAPMHAVRDRYAWVALTLSAGAGSALPSLGALRVLYPGRTLMEYLPAIYQRQESQPGDFLRTLVGVLETTTQELDARIAKLGSRIHPASASGPWLDHVARWLGLPWDDAMSIAQKRAIVSRAADIARGRGTRAGLQALLDAIVAGTPARYRLHDLTADHGIAMVGGGACAGSALPALLGGARRDTARLGARARLGLLRLPCSGAEEDATSRFLGRIRVDIAADAARRAEWSPWLSRLAGDLTPVNASLRLRWLPAGALDPDREAGIVTLADEPPEARLGTDAVTGAARLPERGGTLPGTSTDSGPTLH